MLQNFTKRIFGRSRNIEKIWNLIDNLGLFSSDDDRKTVKVKKKLLSLRNLLNKTIK